MKVLSLYCGAGGIDQGLKQAGIKTTLAVDMVQDCVDTIKLNHDCEVICDEVKNIESSLGKFDVVVGGPPCQNFSVANRNRTLDPTEVNRFWSIVRQTKAKHYLMENVPPAEKVCSVNNYLINCADYGTPQKRVRRFFTALPLPKPTHAKNPNATLLGDPLKKWVTVKEALNLDDGHIEDRKTTFGEGFRKYSIDEPNHTLLADARVWYIHSGLARRQGNQIEATYPIASSPSPTVLTSPDLYLTDHKVYNDRFAKTYGKHRSVESMKKQNKKGAKITTLDNSSQTIVVKDYSWHRNTISDGKAMRKLTHEECAILQGFPRDYKFAGNKSSVMRQIGNAVPSQPVTAFFRQVKS